MTDILWLLSHAPYDFFIDCGYVGMIAGLVAFFVAGPGPVTSDNTNTDNKG